MKECCQNKQNEQNENHNQNMPENMPAEFLRMRYIRENKTVEIYIKDSEKEISAFLDIEQTRDFSQALSKALVEAEKHIEESLKKEENKSLDEEELSK